MTNKHSIEITLPEGYEPDDGLQPRLPKEGDYYWELGDSEAGKAGHDFTLTEAIILRKKAPEYKIKYINAMDGTSKLVKYVEIEALEDAISIINKYGFDMEDRHAVNALKALVEGE